MLHNPFREFFSESSYDTFYPNRSDYIVYSLISIMNGSFQDEACLSLMLKSTYENFGSSQFPVVCLCADDLQNITSEPLKLNVEKEKNKWNSKYEIFKKKFSAQLGIQSLNQEVLYWNTFTSSPWYTEFKKFSKAIFLDDFSDFEDQEFSQIISYLREEDAISTIRNNSIILSQKMESKTIYTLKKKVEKNLKSIEVERNRLRKAGIPIPDNHIELEIEKELKEIYDKLKDLTLVYLAEEFSVFLLINFLRSGEYIQNTYEERSSLFNDRTGLFKPILVYPISLIKNKTIELTQAELTFSTFRYFESLYIKYCFQLKLPVITESLTILDISIQNNTYGNNFDDYDKKSPKIMDSTVIPSEDKSVKKISIIESSIFKPSIPEKILVSLERYISAGAIEAKRVYQNGVSCDVKVSSINLYDENLPRENALSLISMSVENVLNDSTEEIIIFKYMDRD